MGSHDYWKRGQWLVICDVCGFKYHSGDLKKRWDGLMCCKKDWNPRQPQDFVRAVPDPQAVPWSRPDVPPQFVAVDNKLLLDTYGNIIYDTNNAPIITVP